MTALRHRLKSFVWVALVAICGIAFGPSISRALAPAAAHPAHAPGHAMEMGAHAHLAAAAPTDPVEHSKGSDHAACLLDCCALCAVAAAPFASVALVVLPWAAAEGVSPAPADLARALPDRRALWSRAAPRGPPSTA